MNDSVRSKWPFAACPSPSRSPARRIPRPRRRPSAATCLAGLCPSGSRRVTAYCSSTVGPAMCDKDPETDSHGVPHSQREQAPPPVLLTVVKHMATLAQGLQISQPVIGGVMVKVGSGQNTVVVRTAMSPPTRRARRRPHALRQVRSSSSHHRPSPKCWTSRPCGLPHLSHRPLARSNRITAESCGQSIG